MELSTERTALVRQYELLLVHRHRFVMAQTIECIHAVIHELKRAEALLQTALQSSETSTHTRSASTSSASASSIQQRHHHQHQHQPQPKTTFIDAMENTMARLTQLTAQVPVFLGATELQAFVHALRDFTHHGDLDLFWDLLMDAQETQLAEQLTTDVIKQLDGHLIKLERAVQKTLPTATMLGKKREHLIQLVDESMELLAKSRTEHSDQYDKKKKRLLSRFQDALRDPILHEARQIECEIESIETEMMVMLQPHFEICRTVTTANAEVPTGAKFTKHECSEINQFVRLALQLADRKVPLNSVLADSQRFPEQLQLFELAAKTDAFVVFKSALKLDFDDASVDEELFLAYLADWRAKTAQQKELLASAQYLHASQQVSELKEQILQVHAAARNSRKYVALDGPIKDQLSAQIAQVFIEEGGDTAIVTQVLG